MSDASADTFIKVAHTNISAMKREHLTALDADAAKRAVRVYKSSSEGWTFQVRGPETLANYKDGKRFIVASASLTKAQLQELRDAVDALLRGR